MKVYRVVLSKGLKMYFAQNVLAEDANFAGGTMSIQNGTPMCDEGVVHGMLAVDPS